MDNMEILAAHWHAEDWAGFKEALLAMNGLDAAIAALDLSMLLSEAGVARLIDELEGGGSRKLTAFAYNN